MKRFLLSVIIFLFSFSVIHAKTEKFGTWIELTLTKKFLKDFEISFIPELRLQDDSLLTNIFLKENLVTNHSNFLILQLLTGMIPMSRKMRMKCRKAQFSMLQAKLNTSGLKVHFAPGLQTIQMEAMFHGHHFISGPAQKSHMI